MRVLLAMLVRSSGEPYLDAVLSIMRSSFDGVELMYDEGRPIEDFARARNQLVARAESLGYDWIVMLDADECMYPTDIARARLRMESSDTAIAFPTIEMVNDFEHWDPRPYPDYHVRAFRLCRGIRYRRRMHEVVYAHWGVRSLLEQQDALLSDSTPIYHYGKTKPAQEVLGKFRHYESIDAGSTPIDFLDTSKALLWPSAARWHHPHPLDGGSAESGDSAALTRVYLSARQEIELLSEHNDLCVELDSYGGRILADGLSSAPFARYLSQRGHSVVLTSDDEEAVAAVRQLEPAGTVEYRDAATEQAYRLAQDCAFAVAFSVGVLHLLPDSEAIDRVLRLSDCAESLVISVPSDKHPSSNAISGRFLSPSGWERALASAGRVRAHYYGFRFLPLRQAIVAKARGTLRQDSMHVLIHVSLAAGLG